MTEKQDRKHPSPGRKLAAILFSDIAGFTTLMQKDEAGTSILLRHFQKNIEEKTTAFNGEVINFYGDGALCIFNSATEAIRCAIELKKAFHDDHEMNVPVRIGLHQGTVFFENEKAYGNSVNLASRIESIGVPGAVLFSQKIRDEIKNQPDFKVKSLGNFAFKNVEGKIEVFALANQGFIVPKRHQLKGKLKPKAIPSLIKWAAVVASFILAIFFINYYSSKNEVVSISDKSIAVLPFENLNKSTEENYFGDGIAQDILTHLSGIKDLQVISFNSSKKYSGSNNTTKEIGQALGAQHLLSGSVQQNGENLRLRVMLINAKTDQQLWAKRFDRKIEDIFQIQSEVSAEIAEVLKAELLPEVAARIKAKPTENLEAWQEYSQGRHFWELRGEENLKKAEKHFLKAIELDSNFATACAGLALTYAVIGINEVSYLPKSKQLAERAISLNPDISDAYTAIAEYYNRSSSDYSKAIAYYEKAIALEPGNATAYQWYAEVLVSIGEIEKGREMIEAAQKLDPSSKIIQCMSHIFLLAEDKYKEARIALENFVAENPEVDPAPVFLGLLYLNIGEYEKGLSVKSQSPEYQIFQAAYLKAIAYRLQKNLQGLYDLKKEINQNTSGTIRDELNNVIERSTSLSSGNAEQYIRKLDSAIYVLGIMQTIEIQAFPLPDSVRFHPSFEKMMDKRGFYLRPRSPLLIDPN